jgi:hypothetical protein
MGRLTKTQTTRTVSFIQNILEQSGLYELIYKDDISLKMRETESEDPNTVDIVIANALVRSRNAYRSRLMENQADRIFTCPILYEDGTSAFARVVDHDSTWRENKTFVQTLGLDVYKSHKLRDIEKVIMAMSQDQRTAQYYHPQSKRIDECIRTFRMEMPDASCIPGSVGERWKLAREIGEKCENGATFTFRNGVYVADMIVAKPVEYKERQGINVSETWNGKGTQVGLLF